MGIARKQCHLATMMPSSSSREMATLHGSIHPISVKLKQHCTHIVIKVAQWFKCAFKHYISHLYAFRIARSLPGPGRIAFKHKLLTQAIHLREGSGGPGQHPLELYREMEEYRRFPSIRVRSHA